MGKREMNSESKVHTEAKEGNENQLMEETTTAEGQKSAKRMKGLVGAWNTQQRPKDNQLEAEEFGHPEKKAENPNGEAKFLEGE